MSAHGVPGAFSSALGVLWKGILIILSIFSLSKLFVFLFPDFGQSNIKEKISNYQDKNNIETNNTKSEYDFNILDPKTWTYDALLARQAEAEKNSKASNKSRYVKPILVPTIDQWNEKNNPAYKNTYETTYYSNEYGYYKENTAGPDNWIIDGSMWSK